MSAPASAGAAVVNPESMVYQGNLTDFSAYPIHSTDSLPFSAAEYSKFKYGSGEAARVFGHALAEKFIDEVFKLKYRGQPIVVLSSAYFHIPTAAFYLKNHFVEKLNEFLYKNGYPVCEETKITRSVSYREDYGSLSAADRLKMISGDRFSLDTSALRTEEGADKILLFIDDVRITGTHERIILRLLNSLHLTNEVYMLYLGDLVNKEANPNIEHFLNSYFVKDLDDVQWIVKNHTFLWNTRTVKFILGAPEEKFRAFVAQQSLAFIETLYYLSIGNQYTQFDAYAPRITYLGETIKALKEKAARRKSITV